MDRSERFRFALRPTALVVALTAAFAFLQHTTLGDPAGFVSLMLLGGVLLVFTPLLHRSESRHIRLGEVASFLGCFGLAGSWVPFQHACPMYATTRPDSPVAPLLVDISLRAETALGVRMPTLALDSVGGADYPTQILLPVVFGGYLLVFLGCWYAAPTPPRATTRYPTSTTSDEPR